MLTSSRVYIARAARNTAPKAPRPRRGLGTSRFNFFDFDKQLHWRVSGPVADPAWTVGGGAEKGRG